MDRDKISHLQLMMIYVVVIFSPLILNIPKFLAVSAKQAGWVCPVFASIGLVSSAFVFHSLFKKHPNASLMDIAYIIVGKPIGKTLLGIYFVLVLLSIGFHPRIFYERLSSSIMTDTPPSIFLILLLTCVGYVLYQKFNLVVLARFNEVIIKVIGLIFITLILLLFAKFDIKNLLPVSTLDAWPVTKGSLQLLGLYGYLPYMYFMGNRVSGKEKILKQSLWTALVISLMSFFLMITTLGTAGYSVLSRTMSPFYFCVKTISFMQFIERIESVVVFTWILSDFIVLAGAMIVILEMLKSIFNLKDAKSFILPLLLLSYLLSTHLCESRFELDVFYGYILNVLVVVSFIAPPILLAIGKIRKVV